jgi:hypothetical protein
MTPRASGVTATSDSDARGRRPTFEAMHFIPWLSTKHVTTNPRYQLLAHYTSVCQTQRHVHTNKLHP